MSRYLSIRFDLVWAFSTDGASVQILYHVHKCSTYFDLLTKLHQLSLTFYDNKRYEGTFVPYFVRRYLC
jgi:hypothetical protein